MPAIEGYSTSGAGQAAQASSASTRQLESKKENSETEEPQAPSRNEEATSVKISDEARALSAAAQNEE